MKILNRLIVLIMISVLSASCSEEEDVLPINSNQPQFSMDLFEQNIIDYVNFGSADPVGWGYAISKDGVSERSNAYGDARMSSDGQLAFTTNKEINVASVTKFYTAIGAMQLINANGLTIDSNIIGWLPASWGKGVGVETLTFKDLLMHTSGLQSTNSNFSTTLSYSGLQQSIATGVVNSKSRNYLNVNFAMFRVLIPSLWNALPNSPVIDIEDDRSTQLSYLLYMQQNIWDKINLPLVGCFPESISVSTLYYSAADVGTSNNGLYYDDWDPICGGGGYFMTLLEMSKLLAFYEHTEDLLSNELKDIMKTNRIGMDRADNLDEIHGNYYGKGGSIINGGQGVLTQIVMFPLNGVDIVIVMNTQNVSLQGNVGLRQMIYDAYNNAWE